MMHQHCMLHTQKQDLYRPYQTLICFTLNCYYSVRDGKNLFQGLSTTAGTGVISLARQHTWCYVYPSCRTRPTACVILSQKNEVVRYIGLKRPNSAPKVKQHIIKLLIV